MTQYIGELAWPVTRMKYMGLTYKPILHSPLVANSTFIKKMSVFEK